MTTGIEKFRVDNKICVSFWKHRGNIEAISNETDIAIEYVKKVTDKLKRKMKKDVSYNIAFHIMETIHIGYQQRVAHLNECLNKLRNVEEVDVSLCCNAPTKPGEEANEPVIFCLKCSKKTTIKRVQKIEIYKLVQEFTRELREEDKLLVDFADKMGFTTREELPANIYKQNIIVMSSKKEKESYKLSEEDEGMLQDITTMTPIERRRMARNLEKSLLEGEVVKDKEIKEDE